MDIDIQGQRTSLSLLLVGATLLLKYGFNHRKRRPRRWWVRPINRRKRKQGDYYNLYQEMRVEDPDYFFNYTRMTVELFDELLVLLKPYLTHNSNRPAIPAECRLLVTIRLLASGDGMQTVAMAFRMGTLTVCVIFKETCTIIWNILHPLYMPSIDEGGWKEIAMDFRLKWNLPNCVGAIDGKHVNIKQPNNSGSNYFNYKKTFSVVLFGVCDPNYKFIAVDVGAYGSQHDGGVFRDSIFGQRLNDGSLNLPPDAPLPGCTDPFPYFFVGDDAFPLKNNLMKPFGGRNLQEDQRIFNYRIFRARRCIENTFGIMASRWRIFHKTIFAHPDTVDELIKACACLHNFLMTKEELSKERKYSSASYADAEINNILVEGAWRDAINNQNALQQLRRRLGVRNARHSAIQYREYLKRYLNNEGSVHWQTEYVNRI